MNIFKSKRKITKAERMHDVSLTAIIESGIDPITTTAIFVAAYLLLSGQSEVVSVEDVELGKERLQDLPDEASSVELGKERLQDLPDEGSSVTDNTDLIDEGVQKAVEEMIDNFDKAPMPTRSRPLAVSLTSSEMASVKRRVASTLANEIAMKERLGVATEVLMMKPGPQKLIPKPKFIRPPLVEKRKSHVAIRIFKKLAMPWKKYSNLS